MNARQRWRAAYREARKQARFIEAFHDRLKMLPARQRTYPSQCPGFCFTRLSGDQLRWIGEGVFRRRIANHRTLLPCLRHVQPRLPA